MEDYVRGVKQINGHNLFCPKGNHLPLTMRLFYSSMYDTKLYGIPSIVDENHCWITMHPRRMMLFFAVNRFFKRSRFDPIKDIALAITEGISAVV